MLLASPISLFQLRTRENLLGVCYFNFVFLRVRKKLVTFVAFGQRGIVVPSIIDGGWCVCVCVYVRAVFA